MGTESSAPRQSLEDTPPHTYGHSAVRTRMSVLVTEGGRRIPELEFSPTLFVDRTTVIYGPSKTGKTCFVKNIMRAVSGHIGQVLVVAPSEPSNRSYENFVDPLLIHYRLHLPDPTDRKDSETKAATRFLERVWKRQEMMAAIYSRANEPKTLRGLYGRLTHAERKDNDRYLASLERKRRRVVDDVRRQCAREPGRRDEKVKEIDDKFTKMVVLLYKKFLTPMVETLYARKDLTDDERHALHYLHFNPRLLLIFDDCAAQLKPFFNKELFRKIFYMNRHSYITVIICCQDDTDLPTNLRKNAFVSVFTEPIVAVSNFERASNQFPKSIRAVVAEICPEVFVGYRKLCFIREDDRRQHLYHATGVFPRPFAFGSDALEELCGDLRVKGAVMDRGNPYFTHFAV
jgi:hypothetical protein